MITNNTRANFIGGSDVAAIMGVSPWRTPVQVWEEKTGRIKPEEFAVEQSNKAKLFARGRRWEPIALDMLIDELKERGHKISLIKKNERYVDKQLPFMSCEIDAEIMLDGEHVNSEIKTVHPLAKHKWGDIDTDEVPIEYAAQVMHGLGITGRRLCIVGCLIGADDMLPYFIKRDDETILAMRKKCDEFWREHVEKNIPPDPINFQDLSVLFPSDNGLKKEADLTIAEMVNDLANIKRTIKINSERAEELEFQIKKFMEPAAILEFNGRKICTWKSQTTMRFDQKEFEAKFPDQFNQFKRQSNSRVFRLFIK